MSYNLHIGYLNCRGLGDPKKNILFPLVLGRFDVLFLSETWYCGHSEYIEHSNFLTSTTKPPPSPTLGSRYSGGILVLVSPAIRQSITSYGSTKYSIDLTIYSQHIRAIYLPPSLSDMIEFKLNSRYYLSQNTIKDSQPTIILGDFNTYFGYTLPEPNRSKYRSKLLSPTLQTLGLTRITPSDGYAKNHHIFTTTSTKISWKYSDPPILTDHKLMDCIITPTISPPASIEAHRINLTSLKHQFVVDAFCTSYQYLSTQYKETIQMIQCDIQNRNTQLQDADQLEKQSIINYLYSMLSTSILIAAESSCGTYKPSRSRARTMPLNQLEEWSQSPQDAIRMFKYSQRSNTKDTKLESRTSTISPLEDAVGHFTALFHQPDPAFLPTQSFRGNEFDPTIECIDADEISKFWLKYPSSKSCGSDGIHVLLLRALDGGSSLSQDTETLFNICLHLGVTPSEWNKSLLYPTPKSKESKTIDQFRPISLTLMMRRTFEHCLLYRFSIDPSFKLHSTQAGFRSGYSTTTHAMLAHDSMQAGHSYRIFYDLKNAYDTVPVPRLLEKLQYRGVSLQVLALVDALFLGTSTVVVINGVQSDSAIQMTRGLFQGSLLSPLLFDIFIDDLASSLHQDSQDDMPLPRALLCADDITASSNDRMELQISTNKVSQWCHNNGMQLNLSKCGVVGPGTDINITLPVGKIPTVDVYTYLGYPFDKDGINFPMHLERNHEKAQSIFKYLRYHGQLWTPFLKLCMYRTFVRSRLEYGSGLAYQWMSQGSGVCRFPTILPSDASRSSNNRFLYILPTQDLHLEALSWITSSKGKITALTSLLAIPPAMQRFSDLACLLTQHMNGLDEDNPVSGFHSYLETLVQLESTRFQSTTFLIPLCYLHPDAIDYSERYTGNGPRLQVFLREKFLTKLESQGSIMPKYHPRETRVKGTGVCHVVKLRSSKLRERCIAWSLNLYRCTQQCVCKKGFTRDHLLKDCLQEAVMSIVPQPIKEAYESYQRPQDLPFFCIIDYCIWKQHWSALSKIFKRLDKIFPNSFYYQRLKGLKGIQRRQFKKQWRCRRYNIKQQATKIDNCLGEKQMQRLAYSIRVNEREKELKTM